MKTNQAFFMSCVLLTASGAASAAPFRAGLASYGDFNGNHKQELAVYRPSNANFYFFDFPSGSGSNLQWGTAGDLPVPADYDADDRTDLAIFRPSNNTWYLKGTTKGQVNVILGSASSLLVPADYTCDGRADPGVWDKNTGTWSIALAHWTGDPWPGLPPGVWSQQWGRPGDIPVPGDYDQDGCDDFAVWRPSDGTWYVWFQWKGTWRSQQWGVSEDRPVPYDYDGDGFTDFAVWRPSTGMWYVLDNRTGAWSGTQWGQSGDIPVPGDYDGDGLVDFVVWRPSEKTFYFHAGGVGGLSNQSKQWGAAGDIPVGRPSPLP